MFHCPLFRMRCPCFDHCIRQLGGFISALTPVGFNRPSNRWPRTLQAPRCKGRAAARHVGDCQWAGEKVCCTPEQRLFVANSCDIFVAKLSFAILIVASGVVDSLLFHSGLGRVTGSSKGRTLSRNTAGDQKRLVQWPRDTTPGAHR